MSKRPQNGSMCYDEIVAAAKAGHPAFSRAKNGKVYFNIAIWTNEENDKFGNIGTIQLQTPKDKRGEKAVYVGNIRGEFQNKQAASEPVAESNKPDGLPF